MFHKFWNGETEEERYHRIQEEEAAAAAYQELERQQNEVFAIQAALFGMLLRFCLMFWLVPLLLLFKTISTVVASVLYCKKLTPNDTRKMLPQSRKEL